MRLSHPLEGCAGSVKRFLQKHPVVCLLLLTPGIPEYLSGSSPMSLLVTNPALFLLQLAANLGLYGPGVLLIREAMVRWRKGWATVLLLGAAYGILEEGVALSTLFYSQAAPVGILGYYGHWMGVNWVWVSGILLVHMLYSIALPILLLDLALPETHGKSLLTQRQLVYLLPIWGADILILNLLVGLGEHFWAGPALLTFSFLAIGALILVAYWVPADLFAARSPRPTTSPLAFLVVGLTFFVATLFAQRIAVDRVPPFVSVGLVALIAVVWLVWVVRNSGKVGSERCWIALAAGAIAPLCVFGIVSQFPLLVVIVGVVAAVVFLRYLWGKYPADSHPLPPPPPPPNPGDLSLSSGGPTVPPAPAA